MSEMFFLSHAELVTLSENIETLATRINELERKIRIVYDTIQDNYLHICRLERFINNHLYDFSDNSDDTNEIEMELCH